jgi:hypothetical protein
MNLTAKRVCLTDQMAADGIIAENKRVKVRVYESGDSGSINSACGLKPLESM